MNPQLRSHIPIAAPARREAADGSEARLRPVLGFEPRWFHLRCGIDFSEPWHRDPLHRRRTLLAMRAELQCAFPATRQWSGPEARDINTIAGCFGVGFMPAVFGQPLRYYPDRWPHPEPGSELSDAAVEALHPDRLIHSGFVHDLLRQIDTLSAAHGPVHGDLNWQGVLNTAFHLRGQRIFEDMAERPELAAKLFDKITETTIRLAQLVQARQRESGFDIDWMCVSNCTLSMISPAMYRRLLQPHDARVARSFSRFGVHTCNWDATRYFQVLGELPAMGYIDMGSDSQFAQARSLFPDSRRAVLIHPNLLPQPETLEPLLHRIAAGLAPCDLILADIPWDTPKAHVNRFLALCASAAGTA